MKRRKDHEAEPEKAKNAVILNMNKANSRPSLAPFNRRAVIPRQSLVLQL